jgi:2-aminoadipate transaminase
MNFKLARRMAGLRASEIREILKLTQRPEVISFAGGLPAIETFPASDISSVTADVLAENGASALQYSPTEGFPPLRKTIAERMNTVFGTGVSADQILVTSGSQQGIDLLGRVLLDEGDVVLCESPTYLGAINALKAYQPEFVEIETDDDGMVLKDLERKLTELDRVKLIYVVPDFQNPSGRTWTLERRRQVMELVRRFQVPVAEDSPYAEIRFEGELVPPLKALPGNEWVVYLGTFSKVFCPGMRIGWVCAVEEIYRRLVHVKQGADLHTSTLAQMQLSAYLERFDIGENIQRTIALYRDRRDTMLGSMDEHFPPQVRWTRPEGGLFVWVVLPDHLSARDLLVRCLEKDVAFVPGGPFFPNGGNENTLRMNFSSASPERIEEGIRRMATVLRAAIDG